MRISVTVFIILISTYIVSASVLDPVIENVVHLKATKPPSEVAGIWKKKTIWKPRWVKEWKSAKVMKPVWRKVWSPIQIREWVPIPKPPPGWDSISTPLAPVHLKSQKAPLKSFPGPGSHGTQSSTKTLLWDPIPYPESQQPPPPPFPQPLYNADASCGKGRCDNNFSQSMNYQQIWEIIGQKYQTSEYYQNPEYSESVNHLSRLSSNGNNWRPPQSQQNFQPENGLKNYQELSEFLVPPKFQSFIENNFPFQQINKHNPPIANTPISHSSSERQIQNNFPQWIPLPPENKLKKHLIVEEFKQPHKFPIPNMELHIKNDANNSHKVLFQNSNSNLEEKLVNQTRTLGTDLQPQAESDFIQEAQLVGEFHYSEFGQRHLKPEHEPQLNLGKKEQIIEKLQQSKKTVDQESMQKTEPNQQFVIENKPKQTQKEINNRVLVQSQIKQPEVHNIQDNLQGPKQSITNFNSNSNLNFRQQEATVKEISPIYHKNVNPTTVKNQQLPTPTPIEVQEKPLSPNHPFTKLMGSSVHTLEFQHQTESYPVFEIPKRVNPTSISTNHRFFKPSDIKLQEESFPSNNSIRLAPITKKSEKSLLDQDGGVQLVFATTSDEYIHSKKDLQKLTTTEPYEIIFSSSLPSTTEEAVKSPLIIVTPANSKES